MHLFFKIVHIVRRWSNNWEVDFKKHETEHTTIKHVLQNLFQNFLDLDKFICSLEILSFWVLATASHIKHSLNNTLLFIKINNVNTYLAYIDGVNA